MITNGKRDRLYPLSFGKDRFRGPLIGHRVVLPNIICIVKILIHSAHYKAFVGYRKGHCGDSWPSREISFPAPAIGIRMISPDIICRSGIQLARSYVRGISNGETNGVRPRVSGEIRLLPPVVCKWI